MRSTIRFLLFNVFVLALLAACTAQETAVLPQTDDTASQSETAVEEAEPTAAPRPDPYDPDVSLIANTGRPQFVSAYANW